MATFEDADKFGAAIQKWSMGAEADFKKVMKALAFEVHERIIDRTPVDTGRARASWNLSINEPDLTVAPEPKKKSRKAALESAQAARASLPDFDPFTDTIWITNAVSYILRLEHGSSKQAPVGMVVVTVAEVEAGVVLKVS